MHNAAAAAAAKSLQSHWSLWLLGLENLRFIILAFARKLSAKILASLAVPRKSQGHGI